MKNKEKKLLSLLLAIVFMLSGMCVTVAFAQEEITQTEISFEDGEIYEDEYVCGCCHSHSHPNTVIGRLSCLFCKISMFFKNIFGMGEKDVVHKYVVTFMEPATCLGTGKAEYSCVVCGVTKKMDLPKLPHVSEEIPGKEPTCTENGYTRYYKCSLCDKVLTTPKTLYAIAHDFGEYISDNNASCHTDGTKTSVCANCGETKTITDPGTKKEHIVYQVEGKAPTCEEPGYYPYEICYNCTFTTYQEIPATGHTEVTDKGIAPTCTLTGLTDGSHCDVCKKVLVPQEIIEATGHDEITVPGKAPTCTGTGYTDDVTCRTCGAVISVKTELPAKGHTFVDVYVEASCTEGDYTYSKCSVCGYEDFSTKEYGTNPPAGHTFNDGDKVSGLTVSASGTDKVTASITCSRCKEQVTDYEIDAVASVGGYSVVYHTLEAALKAAGKNTVYLLRDYTLKENITISDGVTLVIPCTAGDTGYYTRSGADGDYNKFCPDNSGKAPKKVLFRALNVPEGKTVTIASGGCLLINAVTGFASGGNPNSYGVSGNYAEISLSGNIDVKNGGIFDCSGFVRDAGGTVKLEKGAVMYETYGVLHWRGGSYGFAARAKKIFPIDGYEMNYMKAKLIAEAGSIVEGSCKMYAGDSYHYCHIKILGTKDGYLYKASDSTRVERTVEKDTDKTVFKVYGDMEIGVTSISVGGVTMKTSSFQSYKVDGNTRIEVYDGTLSSNQKVQYMPGFTMIIGKGATLEIEGSLLTKGSMVFCTADDVTYNGTLYKGYCTLDSGYVGAAGAYCPSDRGDAALYVVDGGKVNVAGNSAALAGKVYVDSESSVNFNSGSKKEVTVKLATGKVNGASFLASVDTVNYTIPFMQYDLQ